jgi:hypothetical protein
MYARKSMPRSLANVYTAVMQRRRASARHFETATCQLREKILTEKHRSYRIAGGLACDWQQKQDKLFGTKSEEFKATQGSRASGEDDGYANK